MKFYKPQLYVFITLSVVMSLSLAFIAPQAVVAAACAPSGDYGTVSESVTVPTTGTYRIWSRLKTPVATNNSYMLEIDGGTCYVVGGANLTADTWTWVDYQNGTTSSKVDATLTSGAHSLKMYGNAPNVELDRVILTTDTSCVPTGTGDNCVTVAATPTPTPTSTPTPTPTPTDVPGDVNGDGHVTSLDLAMLLSNWNKQSAATKSQGDLSGDGQVTALDLAMLLSNWGK
jgi:hypothetical protein